MVTEALRYLMIVNILTSLLVGSEIAHESGPKTAPNAMNEYDDFDVLRFGTINKR
jgi:hypothetical protein